MTRGARLVRVLTARRFCTTSRVGLKESHKNTDIDYDKHKQDSLAKQRQGSGHWKPELATASEQAVRADRAARQTCESTKDSIETLQERTKMAAEEATRAGTRINDVQSNP